MTNEKIKAKREKAKLMISNNIGKEPKYTGLFDSSNLDIINALNYYSKEASSKESYAFLKAYIKNNHKELLSKVNSMPLDSVTNKGFLIRMIENGFKFPKGNDVVIQNIIDFIINYQVSDNKVTNEIVPEKKLVKRPEEYQLKRSDVLVDYVDDLVYNKTKEISIILEKPSEYKVIQNYINEILEEAKPVEFIDPDTKKPEKESCYLASTIKRVKEIQAYINKVVNSTKKVIVRKRIRNVEPIKQVAKLKYLLKNDLFNSIKPVDIIGKKKLFVFDTKYRKLRLLIAEESGFSVKGTTIENVNLEKSLEKSVKQKDVPALAQNKNISSINNFFKAIGKDKPLGNTRINENCVLLIAS